MWQLTSSSKVRLLIWRILHEALPTSEWLLKWHLRSTAFYFRCEAPVETLVHALRDCGKSKLLWLQLRPNIHSSDFFSEELKPWVLKNLACKDPVEGIPWAIIFIHAIWLLWFWRNMNLFDKSFIWPANATKQVWTKAKEAWDTLGKENHRLKQEVLIAWEKHKNGYVKLNVDGSAKGQPGLAASGGVIRDEYGNWIAGFCQKIGITFSLTAEPWGIYQGLTLCWNRGLRKFCVEIDSMLALQKIYSQSSMLDPNAQLLERIKELLQQS